MTPHSWPEITAPYSPSGNSSSTHHSWSNDFQNAVSINVDKTVAVIFIRRSHRRLSELRLFNLSGPWPRSVKYLRNTFDWRLIWNEHINNIAKIARISEMYSSMVTTATSHPLTNSSYT
jgi:hypothetical protein